MVLRYTRRYAPPVCGQAQVANDVSWNVNQTGSYITPQWQPNSYSATGAQMSRTVLNFPSASVPACVGLGIQPVHCRAGEQAVHTGRGDRVHAHLAQLVEQFHQ